MSEAADRKHDGQAPLGRAGQPPRCARPRRQISACRSLIVGAADRCSPSPRSTSAATSASSSTRMRSTRRAERMRVEAARYAGEDNKGQKFPIVADRAVQQSSNVPIVDIEGMRARLTGARAAGDRRAAAAAMTLSRQMVAVDGPVRVVGPDGYRLADARRDGRPRQRARCAAAGRSAGTCSSASSRPGRLQRRSRRAHSQCSMAGRA